MKGWFEWLKRCWGSYSGLGRGAGKSQLGRGSQGGLDRDGDGQIG